MKGQSDSYRFCLFFSTVESAAQPYPHFVGQQFEQVPCWGAPRMAQVSVRRAVMVEDVVVLIDRHHGGHEFFKKGFLNRGNSLLPHLEGGPSPE